MTDRHRRPAVPDGEKARLVAWADELRRVHARLRKALSVTQEALESGAPAQTASRDLLLFCHGLCVALTEHHEGEDRRLFPAIAEAHPELRDVLRKLEQDHSMIAHLVVQLQAAASSSETSQVLASHLEGIAAIMENHFRYEERELIAVLQTLALDVDPSRALGPL